MAHVEIVNNHIIAEMEERRVLVDTGAPTSIGLGDLTINAKAYGLSGSNSYMGTSLQSIADSVGTRIDALLGADILSQTNLFVWFKKKEIHFSEMMSPNLPIDLFIRIPMVQVNVNGQSVRACIDTGAQYSYISSNLGEGLQPFGEISDFYPGMGAFIAPNVKIKVDRSLDDNSDAAIDLNVGILPSLLTNLISMMSCEAIIGMDWLMADGKTHLSLDYHNKTVSNY